MLAFVFQLSFDLPHVREISLEQYEVRGISHHDKLFDILLVLGFQETILVLHALWQWVYCLAYIPILSYTLIDSQQLVIFFRIWPVRIKEFIDEMSH